MGTAPALIFEATPQSPVLQSAHFRQDPRTPCRHRRTGTSSLFSAGKSTYRKRGNFRPVWSSWVVEGLFGGYYAYFFAPEKHLKYRLFPNSKLTIYLFLSRQFTIDFLYENRI